MTPAEAQAKVIQAGQEAEFRMKDYQRHGATLETIAKRFAAIQAMRDFASRVPPQADADDVELLAAFEEATREEVGFWMQVYIGALPKMIAARSAVDKAFGDLASAQDTVSAAFHEAAERAKKGGA